MSVIAGTFTRSEKYYYESVIFEVEGTLYRVLKQWFTKWSQSIFCDMFSLPQGPNENEAREGGTDENPIRLVGCSKGEFESLLELMNPSEVPRIPKFSREQWVGVLKLGRLWDMPKPVSLAIETLETFNLSAIEKVQLGRTYGVPTWLKDGYISLVGDFSHQTTFRELATLGFETCSRILWARDELRDSVSSVGLRSLESNRTWVEKNKICCAYCWKHFGLFRNIKENATVCSYCTQKFSAWPTVVDKAYGLLGVEGLMSSAFEVTLISDHVGSHVVKTFHEELEDAERRNALAPA